MPTPLYPEILASIAEDVHELIKALGLDPGASDTARMALSSLLDCLTVDAGDPTDSYQKYIAERGWVIPDKVSPKAS